MSPFLYPSYPFASLPRCTSLALPPILSPTTTRLPSQLTSPITADPLERLPDRRRRRPSHHPLPDRRNPTYPTTKAIPSSGGQSLHRDPCRLARRRRDGRGVRRQRTERGDGLCWEGGEGSCPGGEGCDVQRSVFHFCIRLQYFVIVTASCLRFTKRGFWILKRARG